MARPRKSIDAKRTAPVAVKYTAEERARLLDDVERLGLPSLSELVRQRSLSGQVVVVKRAELAAIDRVELARVGNNLHQLVRHLNFEQGRPAAIAAVALDAQRALANLNALLMRGADHDSEPD